MDNKANLGSDIRLVLPGGLQKEIVPDIIFIHTVPVLAGPVIKLHQASLLGSDGAIHQGIISSLPECDCR
jgi:hypothetical protein